MFDKMKCLVLQVLGTWFFHAAQYPYEKRLGLKCSGTDSGASNELLLDLVEVALRAFLSIAGVVPMEVWGRSGDDGRSIAQQIT